MRRVLTFLLLAQLSLVPAAWGWGAHVHRTITTLALDGLPAEGPAWLRDPAVRQRIAFQANQPDRWRGADSVVLKHDNDPDHYLDLENLEQFGLTLETVSKLRREYLRDMAIAKYVHPEKVGPYDASKDAARTHEWPGFVLHAVAENYAKLQAALGQVRILELLNDPARREQLEQARAIAVYHLGTLSHFAADIAQPLHTTRHHNGWVGDNPLGYHWRDRFHSYIDEGWADRHKLGYEALKPRVKFDLKVKPADPWDDVLAYFRRSHAQLEPLYALERDGKLDGPEGEQLMLDRLSDATAMVSALFWAAYASSEPAEAQVKSWVKYDDAKVREAPPASQPAAGAGGKE